MTLLRVETAVKFTEGAIIAVAWGLLAQGEGGHVNVVCMWVFFYLLTTFREVHIRVVFLCAGQRVVLSRAQEITVQPSRKQEWDLDNRLHLSQAPSS